MKKVITGKKGRQWTKDESVKDFIKVTPWSRFNVERLLVFAQDSKSKSSEKEEQTCKKLLAMFDEIVKIFKETFS
ncbi:MAG: hypothetical protein GNW80_15085 [Asgard group archaeon]|nr:hypothetical protein [Asgard group archaeon]